LGSPRPWPEPRLLWLNIFQIYVMYKNVNVSTSHALIDANNTEPLAISSHRDSVAAHARAQAQTDIPSSANDVNPPIDMAPINQPPPSVHTIPACLTIDEEEDSAEVLSETPAKLDQNKWKHARNEGCMFFLFLVIPTHLNCFLVLQMGKISLTCANSPKWQD